MSASSGVGSTKRLLARELLAAFGVLRCPVCGDEKDLERLTKHHIHPRSLGGPTDLRNLVLICRQCHDNVHQFPSAFWARAALENFLNCRGEIRPFPPPPEPEAPEDSLRYFFARASARSVRDRKQLERMRNPPFNPKWRIARQFPVAVRPVGPAWGVDGSSGGPDGGGRAPPSQAPGASSAPARA